MIGRKVLQIGASLALIGGSVFYLMADSLSKEMEYFRGADEVMAKEAQLLGNGERFRMGGYVAKDSILQKKGTLLYQFEVKPVDRMMKHPEFADKTVTVRYDGVVPDTFKDDTGKSEVIVTGTLKEDGVFYANDMLAKCPSKYEAEEKNQGKY